MGCPNELVYRSGWHYPREGVLFPVPQIPFHRYRYLSPGTANTFSPVPSITATSFQLKGGNTFSPVPQIPFPRYRKYLLPGTANTFSPVPCVITTSIRLYGRGVRPFSFSTVPQIPSPGTDTFSPVPSIITTSIQLDGWGVPPFSFSPVPEVPFPRYIR